MDKTKIELQATRSALVEIVRVLNVLNPALESISTSSLFSRDIDDLRDALKKANNVILHYD